MIPEHHFKRIEEISQFIKNWRINEGLSQAEFASMAELHPNSIHNLEIGKNVTLSTLLNCIDAMDLKLSQFFEGIQ